MNDYKVTIFGSGLIGSGWVTHFLVKEYENVIMYDINEKALSNGKCFLERNMSFLVQEGILSEEEKEKRIGKVVFTTDAEEAVKKADIIIENGPEILSVKQDIIRMIEKFAGDDAIITSSTSGILITEIARGAKHPERIFGCHPYHPVYLLPLLEVTKTNECDCSKLEKMMGFFRSAGKKPVLLKKPSDGYIGSRLMTTLLRESVNLVVSGVCDIKDIDDAFLYGPGMRYGLFGIFTTLQLGGGKGGFEGMMCGPIGQSTDKWLGSFANWDHWPEEAKVLFSGAQEKIDEMISERDEFHGRNNDEMETFRDKGLLKILQAHRMI